MSWARRLVNLRDLRRDWQMTTEHKMPLEKNKCVVVLETRGQFIPVIGINQTAGGYFINYYINKNHPLFGLSPHDSRHESLIALRHDQKFDLFSASEGVFSIDQRKSAEELPCRSVTQDLFRPPISKAELNEVITRPLIVPFEECKDGILVRVRIWPKALDPTRKELRETWEAIPYGEQLVKIFTPECFTNKVSIGVFSTDRLMSVFPFFIDEPVTSDASTTWQSVGSPLTFLGKRKGRGRSTRSEE